VPSDLELALLGTPRVTRAGTDVPLDTRKAVALLAYLAVTAEAQGRDSLAGLLWPDYPQERARAALRRTLSVINTATEGRALEVSRSAVRLVGEGLIVDVTDFTGLLADCSHAPLAGGHCVACLSALERAVALYRGDFLAGFSLRDSAEFDDWQSFQAESLRQRLAGGLDRLSSSLACGGQLDAAVASARRWLALDTLHEPAYRRLMELLTWTGQRSAALAQYRTCVRVLDHELGVAPLAETTALYQAIRENRAPTAPVSRVPLASVLERRPGPALVGRASDLAALLGGYRAAEPDGRLLAVTGEPGIGKTRLAEEVAAAARAAGSIVVLVRGHEEESGLAFGTVIAGMRAAMSASPHALERLPSAWRTELRQLMPDLPPGDAVVPPVSGPAAQTRIHDACSGVLCAALSGPAPGLIVVDDAQWADDASLAVLGYLVRRLNGHPLAVLLAWRDGEGPGAARLVRLLSGALREGVAVHVAPDRLTRADIAVLCPDIAIGDRLYTESEGLPFLVTEYLAALDRSPAGQDGGAWNLPRGAADLLRQRLSTVSESATQVLGAAAVAGHEFRYEVVRRAGGRGDAATAGALDELLAAGLLCEVDGPAQDSGRYAFTHDKLREVAYAATSSARRRVLHRRVAAALAERRDADEQAALIGAHLRAGGEDAAAALAFARAARRAFELHAHAETALLAADALALGHPEAMSLHELLGDVAVAQGRYTDAAGVYEAAAARLAGTDLARVEQKLGELHSRQGDHDLADSHFRAALELLQASARPAARAGVLAARSLTAHRRGAVEAARRYAEDALACADEPVMLARVHNLLGLLANAAGDAQGAAAHLEEALALAHGPGGEELRVAALNNLAVSRAAEGRLEDAVALRERALVLCRELGDRHREGALHTNLADLLHAAGRREEARAHVKASVELLTDIGEPGVLHPGIWMLQEW
jgi:DNA-binding SARP family transcriptional activator/tetratricopeptide (TPR) repeat protein